MKTPDVTFIDGYRHIRYFPTMYEESEMRTKSEAFYKLMDQRRSVREIDSRAVPREIIEDILLTAATAPSGAHKQPWTFCAIADKQLQAKIRNAAEIEEKTNYTSRMSER